MEHKKLKCGSFFRCAAMVTAAGMLVFAAFRVAVIIRRQSENSKTTDRIVQAAVSQQVPALPEQAEKSGQQESVTMPISVDFALLQQENADIVAWIYCPDTPINYPVLQGEDNEFYLNHMVDGQWNPGGSIFLDCRSSAELTDAYSLLHGHNQHTEAMFGTLPSYADQNYYEQHKLLYILTPTQNYILELFAGFDTRSDDGLFSLPMTQSRRDRLVEDAVARSDFYSDLYPQAEDRLLALSTCSYAFTDARYIVLGVLTQAGSST